MFRNQKKIKCKLNIKRFLGMKWHIDESNESAVASILLRLKRKWRLNWFVGCTAWNVECLSFNRSAVYSHQLSKNETKKRRRRRRSWLFFWEAKRNQLVSASRQKTKTTLMKYFVRTSTREEKNESSNTSSRRRTYMGECIFLPWLK